MSASGTPPEKDPSGLPELVAECIDRWEDEGPAALDALCREHPAQARELRTRIGRLGEAGLLGQAGDDGKLPERVGAFRILSLLGRGAMGVVYLAEQEELGRRVALKLVRPDVLFFPGARERFRREVQAVARLTHPGIVRVYAGGEDHGIPWCAMEFVRGATLAEIIDELEDRDPAKLSGADLLAAAAAVARRRAPEGTSAEADVLPGEAAERLASGTWSAACLRVARQVAEALSHAHAHGVLHRDVKPGNIMLTADGRVLLLDFGLAAAEGSARLTSSGGQVGSLAWMSPEQLRGEREAVDARSDVYSLGATLYELLTLRSPFAAGGVETTLARVLAGRADPPRVRNPAIPRDAETVCLTAMEREPARRYASAEALAADLANVLELRPIAARRPGALLRARRWAQRRPAAATGVVLGALLLVAGPVGWELNRVRTLRQVKDAYDASQSSLATAERNVQAALGAIDHVLRETASEDLEDIPRMQQVRLAAIDRALELFPALEQDRPGDALVMRERAALHLARGDMLRDLGRADEGLVEYRKAAELSRRLVASDPSPARKDELAMALNDAGKTLFATFHATEALPNYDESLATLRAALAVEPDDVPRLRQLAVGLANLAESQRALENDAATDAALREGLAQLDRAQELRPGDAELTWTEGRLLSEMGDLEKLRGHRPEALEWQERGLAAWREAHAADPQHRYYTYDVTTGLLVCAQSQLRLRQLDEAETRLEEGRQIMDTLLRDFPDSQRYRLRRAELLDVQAICVGLGGDHARAYDMLVTALADKELLCARDPSRCDLQVMAAKSQVNMANSLAQRAMDFDQVRELLGGARRRLLACAAAGSLPAHDAGLLDNALYLTALNECVAGELDAARAAIADYDEHVPASADSHRHAADLWNEWVLALRRKVPDPAARAADEADGRAHLLDRLTRAVDAGYDDLNELRSTPSLASFRDEPEFAALLARIEGSARP